MQNEKIILMGYSGHSLVIANELMELGYTIAGYFDKTENKSNPLKINYLGYEKEVINLQKFSNFLFFPAIGDNYLRKNVVDFLIKNNLKQIKVISPKSNISNFSKVGINTFISQGTSVGPFVKIGSGVVINTSAVICHESIIADYSQIGPGAVLAGNVEVKQSAYIGGNAVIKQGVTIGEGVIIGAGAVVISNCISKGIYVGNPAKLIK